MKLHSGQFSFDSLERSLTSSGNWETAKNTLVLTFAGVVETLKSHENSIKELELLISNKPSRHEVKAEISEKVSFQDLKEKLNHSNSLFEAKFILFEDKPSYSDIEKILAEYPKLSDVKKIIENKASVKDMNSEIDSVYKQIDKVYSEICEALAKLPNLKDLDFFSQEIKSKASLQSVEEILHKSLEPIQKSLKSKAEKNEVLKKADNQDLRSLISVLDSKVSQEVLEKCQQRVEKLEKNENLSKKKLEKMIKDLNEEQKNALTETFETRIAKHSLEYSRHLNDLNRELKHLQDHPLSNSSEMAHLKVKLDENIAFFDEEIENIKENMKTLENACRNEISLEKVNFRDVAAETVAMQAKALDQELKVLKAEQVTCGQNLLTLKENLEQISAHLQVKLKELTNNYHSNLTDLKSFSSEIQKKADIFVIEDLIHEKNKKIVASLVEIKEDLQKRLESISQDTFKKAQNLVHRVFEEKAIEKMVSGKADKKDLEFILKEIKNIQNSLETAHKDFTFEQMEKMEEIRQDYTERFTSVIVELRDKTWNSDMVKIIDSKASVDDVNNILIQLHNEIDEKITKSEFKEFVDENGVILNTLCAEICIGRWLWKSGSLREKMVVWDEENTNTNPLLFVWETGKNFILVEEAGIFELCFAVFSIGKVEVFVNSLKVITSDGEEDSGCSRVKFVVLANKSRVSLKFSGTAGQGFLSLKKL
jgi:hypothetical protein